MSNFYNEVKKQPEALRNFLDIYREDEFKSIHQASKLILKNDTLLISGMGTSYYAPSCIAGKICGKVRPIIIETGELIDERMEMIRGEKVIMLISQSGESIEITKLIDILDEDTSIIGITNNPDSTLGEKSDVLLSLNAGAESSITNKTFTNTLALLFLLECCINKKNLNLCCDEIEEASFEMDRIINEYQLQISGAVDYLLPADVIHFIGRGDVSMTLADQSALIFMEGAKCNARAFSTGGFRHGPIEVCNKDHRAIFYLNNCTTSEKTINLINQISDYGSHSVLITDIRSELPNSIMINAKTDRQYTLAAAVVMELILISTAKQRGTVAGEFNITNKICRTE